MTLSSRDLCQAARDWTLTAPRRGASGSTEWRAGYFVVETDGYIDLAVSYTRYGPDEPEFDTKRRRVSLAELRELVAARRTVRVALTAVVLELFEDCGIEPPL